MPISNNIWELAELYLAGTLPQAEFVKLKTRLAADAEFATEFYEVTDLLRSVEKSGKQKRFRNMLSDIHTVQNGAKKETAAPAARPAAKQIAIPAQWWRTAAVAAGVALFTSAIMFWSLQPSLKNRESQYNTISRQIDVLKKTQEEQKKLQDRVANDVKDIKANTKPAPSSDVYKTGTGFAISNDGYFVTSYHVIHDEKGYGDSNYVQCPDGQYYKASMVAFNSDADIAIMKIDKSDFRFAKGDLPYTFADEKAGLGSRIFTLGYPKGDVVYSEGYISSRNGYEGNTLQYTLELPAGNGQSGSPVLDADGDVLAILTAVGSDKEEFTYAVSTKAVLELLHSLPNEKAVKLPHNGKLDRLNREQQIEKMQAFTFPVKVYKK